MTPMALRIRKERGAALLETALALPMVLLVAVGICVLVELEKLLVRSLGQSPQA